MSLFKSVSPFVCHSVYLLFILIITIIIFITTIPFIPNNTLVQIERRFIQPKFCYVGKCLLHARMAQIKTIEVSVVFPIICCVCKNNARVLLNVKW